MTLHNFVVTDVKHYCVCSGCGAKVERWTPEQRAWDGPDWYTPTGDRLRGFRCLDCQKRDRLRRRPPGVIRRWLSRVA